MPRIVTASSSAGASAEYDGVSTVWQAEALSASASADLFKDAKGETLVVWNPSSGMVEELELDGLELSGNNISGLAGVKSVQVDCLTGDIYALTRHDTSQSGSEIWGGKLYRKSKGASSAAALALSFSDNGEAVSFFGPSDMKIDPPRRRIWVADTANHRLMVFHMDTLKLLAVFAPDDLVCCCGVAVDASNGDVASRWYSSDGLKERILHIEDLQEKSSYSAVSRFGWGDFGGVQAPVLAVVDASVEKRGLYTIDAVGHARTIESFSNIPRALSSEFVTCSTAVLFANGEMSLYGRGFEDKGTLSFSSGGTAVLFPSHYGARNWVGAYSSSRRSHSPKSCRLMANGEIDEMVSSFSFQGLLAGACAHSSVRPTMIVNNGKKVVLLDRSGTKVVASMSFSSPTYDVLAQDAASGDLFLGKKGGTSLDMYDKDLGLLTSYELPAGLVTMAAKDDGDGGLWALLQDRNIVGLALNAALKVSSIVGVPPGGELRGVASDYQGGAWAWDQNTVFRISDDGLSIEFQHSGFSDIVSGAVVQQLSYLYDDVGTPFPSSQSMCFDPIRRQLWWLSSPGDRVVSMVNLNSNTGNSVKVFDQFDSSSSSSESSSSSSKSTLESTSRTVSSESSSDVTS